jgi:Zn-dependent M28 family amino/carboxypeptidase
MSHLYRLPMPVRSFSILLGMLLVTAVRGVAQEATPAAEASTAVTEAEILAHTRFLSDDLLAGRAPGTRGEALAQSYVIAQFSALGLEPAGDDGWLQPFKLVSLTSHMPEQLVVSNSDGETVALAYDSEWVGGSGRQSSGGAIEGAEIVFVGYGIVAPEESWNDYEGVDVEGKVLLFLNNDPVGDRFAGDTRLYYGRWSYKYEIAAELGAAGAIIIHTTPSAGYPWQVVQRGFGGTELELPAPPDEPRTSLRAWVTEDAAARIAALGGHDFDALVERAQSPAFRATPLGVTLDLEFSADLNATGTANVLARLPGNDPDLADEHIVFTAHYDHLGVGTAVDGDSIYNGARDNALGTATLLAIARAFASLPDPPRRSILFAAVGAEESGLLGSLHLARHPPVPACQLVANINLDGGNIWGRTRDVRQVGRGKSDLDAWLDRFGAEQGRSIHTEEFPDKGYFYRSDQFNFAKIGVPAIYLDEGVDFIDRPEGWGAEQVEAWIATDYHQPSDEITPEWDLSGMVDDAVLLFRVARAVANADASPRWTPGDEFAAAREACHR